jgi:UDP-N-acetylglucosamine 2-epimerase
MKKSQSLEYITSAIMEKFSRILDIEKPDLVLVHGDTATCLICSLASFYRKIPVGHVEAGLRTHDIYSPFPEEMNRKLVGSLAKLHFCPTESNRLNLLDEGVSSDDIFVTGNTAIDALNTTVDGDYIFNCEELNDIDYMNTRVILLTAHRRENLGKPLENICDSVIQIAGEYDDVVFVYPVHPNPAVQKIAKSRLSGIENVILTEMLDVRDLHNLMKRSYMVMTDSGGLQEEAPALGKPVLVLRKETERPEAVEMGTVKLSGIKTDDILADARMLLSDNNVYSKMATAVNPYGDGNASMRIHNAIIDFFNGSA